MQKVRLVAKHAVHYCEWALVYLVAIVLVYNLLMLLPSRAEARPGPMAGSEAALAREYYVQEYAWWDPRGWDWSWGAGGGSDLYWWLRK